MQNIVIVGAGKIGSMIAELLAGSGDYAVTVVDRSQTQLDRLETVAAVTKIAADITHGDTLQRLLTGQFAVLSAAPLPRHPPHSGGRQGRRRALPGSDRGRRQHPRRETARRRGRAPLSFPSAAWRRASSPSWPAIWRRASTSCRTCACASARCRNFRRTRSTTISPGAPTASSTSTASPVRLSSTASCARHSRSRNSRNSRWTVFCTRRSTPRVAWARCARRWPGRCATSTTAPFAIRATPPS